MEKYHFKWLSCQPSFQSSFLNASAFLHLASVIDYFIQNPLTNSQTTEVSGSQNASVSIKCTSEH